MIELSLLSFALLYSTVAIVSAAMGFVVGKYASHSNSATDEVFIEDNDSNYPKRSR